MNWKVISETCPNAWAEFMAKDDYTLKDNFLAISHDDYDPCGPGEYSTRDLYDHFDALDIRITVQCRAYGYCGYYRTKESNGRTDGELHETRTEAESVAFTRAFQLRDDLWRSLYQELLRRANELIPQPQTQKR